MRTPGIAIITYKRPSYLAKCLDHVRRYTSGSHELVVVCDAVDDLESEEVCDEFKTSLIKGENRGVVWNKNRGLYYFMSKTECDPIILLEDDTYPISEDWLEQWADAVSQWQHVNYSHRVLLTPERPPLRGSGTPADPHIHSLVTGQCTAVSRVAMSIGGYLDTRFRGYGHGHVEWTKRHAALLFGGVVAGYSRSRPLFVSIGGSLEAENAPSFRSQEEVARNGDLLALAAREQPGFRNAWRSEEERLILTREIDELSQPVAGSPKPRVLPPPSSYKGFLDRVEVSESKVVCIGWALGDNGQLPDAFSVRSGKLELYGSGWERRVRKDVARRIPGARLDCGFEISATLPQGARLAPTEVMVAVGPRAGDQMTMLPRVVNGASEKGSSASVSAAVVSVPEAPHIPPEAAQPLFSAMAGSSCYLEYGSGGSTVKACEIGIPEVISVESDVSWLDAVRAKTASIAGTGRQHLIHIDLGPTKEWGHPAFDVRWREWHRYPLAPWTLCKETGLRPDLVLIDGRFRISCFLSTLLFGSPGCRIFFDDYVDRPAYHVVERILMPIRHLDRVAEFRVPDRFDRDAAWLELITHISNPA